MRSALRLLPVALAAFVFANWTVDDARAQSCAHTAQCDQTITANLDFSAGTCLDSEVRRYDTYTLELVAPGGGRQAGVAFDVSSPFFPPALKLVDATTLAVIAQDTNDRQELSARVVFTTTVTRKLMLIVRNINVGDGGTYVLRVGCYSDVPPPPPPPPPPAPIVISVRPTSQLINRGETATYTITTKTNNFNAPLALSVSDVPFGVVPSLDTTTIPAPGNGSATLSVFIGTESIPGSYSMTIRASSPPEEATANVGVNVSTVCNAPRILGTQPGNKEVLPGGRVLLVVDPSGTSPIRFQWYEGPAGFRSNPVKGATTAAFLVPPTNVTTQYWVEAKNMCGTGASPTATVTVLPEPPRRRPVRR